ncbi:MAG: DUF1569 domain-containing protein [Weeksellaceae bacterium]|nr:DUF1569 domain-containing protein [Weeksellaceae bacterium]
MNKLKDQLRKIESLLPQMERENLQISKASVGWHLEHSLLILNGSLKGLTMTDPKDYRPKFSVKKFVFLTFGLIPRGKIKAPKQFMPLEIPTRENILKLIKLAYERLATAQELPAKAFIKHPFLGDLDMKTTLRFLGLHTNHHLKIIDDILK